MKIAAVINTHNEEKIITQCLKSVAAYVDEIVVVDMESNDRTEELARKYTDKVWSHKYLEYVEPARNFAISKATSNWILLLDADEVLTDSLGDKLRKLAEHEIHAYYRLPRKNIIFGKWMKHTGWWPDYQIRFFKKGAVSWNDEIHSIPITQGKGMDLVADEHNALIHNNYQSISQFLERLDRYTTLEARQKLAEGYKFSWENILLRPGSEFITRFFAWEGFKDGLHGLALSLLQAVSFMVVELKIWEEKKFNEVKGPGFIDQVIKIFQKLKSDIFFWHFSQKSQENRGLRGILYKIRAKIGL